MFIYCIKNTKNNKIYIGQTVKDINIRFAEHIDDALANSNCILHRAMKKYGIENFYVELVETVECRSLLSPQEIFWIAQHSTLAPNGYNMTVGGEGGNTYIALSQEKMQEIKQKISKTHSNKKISVEARKLMSDNKQGERHPFYGKSRPDQSEWMQKNNPNTKELSAIRWANPEYKAKRCAQLSEARKSKGNAGDFKPGNIPWNKGINSRRVGQ